MTALFEDLLGQTRAVALLEASLVKGRLAPAYLFAGPDGVGRRLAALRFLEGVLAGLQGDAGIRRRLQEGNHPDLLWVEPTYQDKGQLVPASKAEELGLARRAAPQLRLEQIRDVSRFLSRRAVEARGCVVVLEDAEAMAEGAANALLKTLEEPGEGLLILIAAKPEQLLTTIRSRCQQIPFTRLSSEQLAVVLERCGEPAPTADPPELLELAAGSPGACCVAARPGQPCLRGWRQGCWIWQQLRSPSRPWPWQGIWPRPLMLNNSYGCLAGGSWLYGGGRPRQPSSSVWNACVASCAPTCSRGWPGKWPCWSWRGSDQLAWAWRSLGSSRQ